MRNISREIDTIIKKKRQMEILKLKTEKYEKNKIHWIGFKSKLGTAEKKDQ